MQIISNPLITDNDISSLVKKKKKKRAKNYEPKLAIDGSLDDVLKVSFMSPEDAKQYIDKKLASKKGKKK